MLWGAAYREGQPPCAVPGPGWLTNVEQSWETGDGSAVTPMTTESVEVLGIGEGGSGWPSGRAARLALELQFGHALGEQGTLSDAGLKRAAAVAAASVSEPSAPEKWACAALLQLPLDGILRYELFRHEWPGKMVSVIKYPPMAFS